MLCPHLGGKGKMVKQTKFEVTNAETFQPVLAAVEDALSKGKKVEVSLKVVKRG